MRTSAPVSWGGNAFNKNNDVINNTRPSLGLKQPRLAACTWLFCGLAPDVPGDGAAARRAQGKTSVVSRTDGRGT